MDAQEIITSRENAKLKYARAVREGREPDAIFIEGVRLVREAFRSPIMIEHLLISADPAYSEKRFEFAELVENTRLKITKVAPNLFPSIADTENSQGVIALGRRPVRTLADLDLSKKGTVIFLQKVNNPSNLGAVVRTAEAAGARGLIVSKGSSDAFTAKAIRASMGSAFRLPILEGVEFGEAIKWANENGSVTTAADIRASKSYSDIDWSVPRLLVFGSEAHGLNEKELGEIEQVVRIPMENEVESLNLAVSAGIILFEARRQAG